MAERSLLGKVTQGLDDLLQEAAHASARLRRMAERGTGPDGRELLAELVARCLDRAEGPGLAALRRALREELARWEPRVAGDPSAARVRDVVALVLEILEPERSGAERQDA